MIRRLLSLLVLATLLSSPGARAEGRTTTEHLQETSETKRFRFLLAPEYVSVSGATTTITAAGVNAGVLYGITGKFGLQADLGQAFYLANASSLYTELAVRLTYAVTGSLLLTQTALHYKGSAIYEAQNESEGGLRVQVSGAEFLFNATSAIIPYSGLGGALYYELPSHSALSYLGGVRMDSVVNGRLSLTPLQFFVGIGYWF